MLSGEGEAEPNADQAVQLALEFCKEDVVSLVIHKLHILGWEVSKELRGFSICLFLCFFLCLIEIICYVADKKRFTALLVYLVEAKSWGGLLLCAVL